MEHFGGNDHVFTTGEIPQCATNDLFAATIGIAIGGIKEIYAAFQCAFNYGTAALFRQCPCMLPLLPYSSYFKLHVLRLHSFTPVTYLCKLLGLHSFAAFLQLELFRVYE